MKDVLKYVLTIIVFPLLVQAQSNSYSTFHPFSDKIIISSEFGFTQTYSDYLYSRPDILARGSLEYYFPSKTNHAFGIKALAGFGRLKSFGIEDFDSGMSSNFETPILNLGAGISYARKWGYTVPYISILLSHLRINPQNSEGDLLPNNEIRKYKANQSMYTGEFGIRFIITKLWSVNLGMNYNITNTDYLDDYKFGKTNDSFLSLFFGISLYHGGDNDEDNDGVADDKDVCPNTKPGIEVNNFGCPKDSDSDGIADYIDKCPNTPRNILIDEFGCPLDSNNDGTPDYREAQIKVSEDTIKTQEKTIDEEERIDEVEINDKPIEEKVANEQKNDEEIAEEKAKGTVKNDVSTLNSYDFVNEQTLNDFIFTDGRQFCFQVAAFKTVDKAREAARKLIEEGHNAIILKAYPFNNDVVWFRIRVGFFSTLNEAKQYRAKYFN